MNDKYVFDTSALLTYIKDEEGAETIADLLGKALDGEISIFISIITALEFFSASVKKEGWAVAKERLELMEDLPLTQEPLIPDLRKTIGEMQFKIIDEMTAVKRLPFADSCIAGLAKSKNAILVHKDRHFQSVEDEIEQLPLPYHEYV
uniref:Predicted nucleic acid-binding protein, contains PIN domain n=1 Tax=Candidatus Kentrum sp. SD TaxID=2126332 RepID=A0A450YFS0_9GAMM|nr:MAG: Predicted nucleic acid-binding protein, contains PIN domain [Candidatus Kentron sp. SD]VFK40384.1 MAG: Predicted nucleic acid-binding protein, contains PIN domain [Candidatus Kentron sp. SD]VFK78333.1 MAG: Predicted nucleic acid-binding protein, contains PIN domain [Candidatus Kentron sp. SD]